MSESNGKAGSAPPAGRGTRRPAVVSRLARACGLALAAGWLGWWLGWATPLLAQQGSPRIVEIRVEGAPQVERGQIMSGLRTRVGEPVDAKKITADIKQIFSLGFFEDVRAEVDRTAAGGLVLIFSVVGKARVADLKIVGNTILGDTKLEEIVKLKPGSVFSAQAVDGLLESFRQAYREKGYFKVQLTSRLERLPENRVRIFIIAEESPRLYITRIETRGNIVFTDLEIKRMMSSAEIDCFDWISDSGVFDEMKINQDLQVITAKYLAKGYLKVFIEKPKVRLVHNREFSKIFVSLTIREGEKYLSGNIDISGDVLGKKSDLLDALILKPGSPFDPFKHSKDRFKLSEIYQEQGYAFVRVAPQVTVNEEARTVDIRYRIFKGDKAYIGRIEFQGNRETRDFVMRREFEVQEKELFNGRKLRVSQQNLTRLGFFSPGISLERQETDMDNELDLVTKVKETQTGTLQASMGVSDVSGATMALSLSKGNLFGRGQTLRLTATAAQRNVTENYKIDFIEPHLFGSEISSDTSLAKSTAADTSELSRGNITEFKISQGFGFPLIPLVRWGFSLSLTKRDFQRPANEPSDLRTVTNSLVYNSVNHPIFPSSGMRLIFALSQIGGQVLGGDTEYRRFRFRARRFYSLNEANTLILMTRLRLGWLQAVGDHLIPVEDRFRLGGITSVRGYNFREIGGPFGALERKLNSDATQAYDAAGDPIVDSSGIPAEIMVDRRTLGLNDELMAELRSGGTQERLFNVELLFPLAGDNIRGVVFFDAGNVTAENRQYEILAEDKPDFWTLRQAIGFGVRMITPLGVFRFEYGRKLKTEEGEAPDKFDFTISSLF